MRIGVIGAGPWARTAAGPALAAHPGVEFVGTWARRPDAAAALGAPVFDSVDALIDAVDAVAIAVPPRVQTEVATRAVRAGRHVLLDKPIAHTLTAAQDLVDEIDAAGVTSMVTLTRRFAPETRAFVASLDGHTWSAAQGTWLSGAVLGGDYARSQWRHDGGALIDVGPHVFDLLDVALGTIEDVAHARRDAGSDTWTVTAEHAGGGVSTAVLSLATPVRPSVFRVSVSGPDGVRATDDRSTEARECYTVLLDEFLESAASGTRHPFSAHRGLYLQRVLDMVQRAL